MKSRELIWLLTPEPRETLLETNTMRSRFHFRTYSCSLTNKINVGAITPLRWLQNVVIPRTQRWRLWQPFPSLLPHLRTDISQPEINCEIQATHNGINSFLEELSPSISLLFTGKNSILPIKTPVSLISKCFHALKQSLMLELMWSPTG